MQGHDAAAPGFVIVPGRTPRVGHRPHVELRRQKTNEDLVGPHGRPRSLPRHFLQQPAHSFPITHRLVPRCRNPVQHRIAFLINRGTAPSPPRHPETAAPTLHFLIIRQLRKVGQRLQCPAFLSQHPPRKRAEEVGTLRRTHVPCPHQRQRLRQQLQRPHPVARPGIHKLPARPLTAPEFPAHHGSPRLRAFIKRCRRRQQLPVAPMSCHRFLNNRIPHLPAVQLLHAGHRMTQILRERLTPVTGQRQNRPQHIERFLPVSLVHQLLRFLPPLGNVVSSCIHRKTGQNRDQKAEKVPHISDHDSAPLPLEESRPFFPPTQMPPCQWNGPPGSRAAGPGWYKSRPMALMLRPCPSANGASIDSDGPSPSRSGHVQTPTARPIPA